MNKKFCLSIFLFFVVGFHAMAQFFPIGMTWEEEVVVPQLGGAPATVFNTRLYEIRGDTLVGNVTYRKVLENGNYYGMCVRESDEKVWLLTRDYASELLLYDFDWDSDKLITMEYLRVDVYGEVKLFRDTMEAGDYQTLSLGDKVWQYHQEGSCRSIIRGIGKVAELNRNQGLLGYKETSPILPGLEWKKVLWIKRDCEEVFRSDNHCEWTYKIPSVISDTTIKESERRLLNNAVYDLQGRRVKSQGVKGVYIQNGRKRVVR